MRLAGHHFHSVTEYPMRIVTLFVLLLVAAPASWAQQALTPGQTQTGTLATGDADVYTLDLTADQFVAGEADQQTVDVVVTITGPDGEQVGQFDGPARGAEPFQFTTEADGVYTITITPFEDETGAYAITLRRAEAVATTPDGRISQLLAVYDRPDVPGAVVAIVRDGQVESAQAFGAANLTHDLPFTDETVTNIGSTSKQFTAFALALLASRGELSLDDDVRTHIPELPDFGQTVTIRNLLTHTTGYREFLNLLAMSGRRLDFGDYIDRSELIAIVQNQPALQNDPGAEWNYNNTGYGLAAEIVARVGGAPFPEWMEENVFEPLGMTSTVVKAVPGQVIENSAQGYLPVEGGAGWRESADLGASMGAGGIYTTVGDLARWMGNLETGAYGGPEIIEEMTTPYVLTTGDTTEYGLGLFIDELRGQRRINHGGADTAHRSHFHYFPDVDTGVIVLSNNAAFDGSVVGEVIEVALGDALEPEAEAVEEPAVATDYDPASFDPETFDAYAGRYALDIAPQFVLAFRRDGDTYYTQATGQQEFEIVPVSDTTFTLTVVDAQMTFHREGDGSVNRITLHQNGQNQPASRVGEDPPTLSDYTGRYFSEELETYVTIREEEDGLVIYHRRFGDDGLELTHASGERFGGDFPLATVEFEREGEAVTAFRAGNGRTRDVWFRRMD